MLMCMRLLLGNIGKECFYQETDLRRWDGNCDSVSIALRRIKDRIVRDHRSDDYATNGF